MKRSTMMLDASVRALIKGGSKLADDIARLIQVESTEVWEYEKRRGRIHSASLYRVAAGHKDVFRTLDVPIVTGNTAIQFLGDASGSMAGSKFYALVASFCLLNKACEKMGFPYEFTMFTEDWEGKPQFFVLKDFDKSVTEDQIIRRCEYVSDRLGNNPDGEALLWAGGRLLQRQEERKILIVLSDGQPATSAAGDAAHHLKKVVETLETVMEVIGIGLLSKSVQNFYKHYEIVHNSEDLDKMFLNLVKNKLLCLQ